MTAAKNSALYRKLRRSVDQRRSQSRRSIIIILPTDPHPALHMPRFLGLRGNSLNIATILGVLMPGILTIGYNASLLGGVLTLKNFEEQFPEINIVAAENKPHASKIQGLVVASYTIGGLFGTLSCIWLGDRFGRRRTIMTGSVVQVLGAVLMASAGSLVQLITSRVILGVGTGVLLATIPLWQSEISPANKRGAHVGMKGIFSGFGCALALFLDFGMSFTKGSVAWRFPFAFVVLLSIAVLVFIYLLPESPRWLIRQGRLSEASEVLAALEDTCVDDQAVQTKIKDVQASLDLFEEKSLRQIFHMGPQRTFHRAMIAALAMLFLQLTGSTVITFYSTHSESSIPYLYSVLTHFAPFSNRNLRKQPFARQFNIHSPGSSLPASRSPWRSLLCFQNRRTWSPCIAFRQCNRQFRLSGFGSWPRNPSRQPTCNARCCFLHFPVSFQLHHRIWRYTLSLRRGDCAFASTHDYQQL